MNHEDKINLLLNNSNFRNFLNELLILKKNQTPEFNQLSLSKILGFSSKGTISDILKGRRKFPLDKLPLLSEFLSLSKDEMYYLKLLLDLEHEKNEINIQDLHEKLKIQAKIITLSKAKLSNNVKNSLLAFEIFASFGIFDNSPTLDDLVAFFGKSRQIEIENTLQILIAEKQIQRIDKKYQTINKELVDNTLDIYENLKANLTSNISNIDMKANYSFFFHQVVGCKKSDLPHLIKQFRKRLMDLSFELAQLENDSICKILCASHPIY